LLIKVSVLVSGLFAAAGFIWLVLAGMALVSAVPMAVVPLGPLVSVTAAAGNFAVALMCWFGALVWLAFGQMLEMFMEVTENSRYLRKLGKDEPAPMSTERFLDAPWMRKNY
jgi:hypothetical protein